MKLKSILAILLLMTGLQSALAQKFTVYMANKQVVKFSVTEVDSIVFSELDDWVDLGLPSGTLWATCNLGASRPEEYGDYFAWGETEPKSYYDFRNYKHCDGHQNTLTRYCPQEQYGVSIGREKYTDSLTELLPEDDAATMNLGIEWQMPSSEQYEELINNNYTTTTWTTQNNVYGCKITSKSNGNSIFMPAGGRYEGEILRVVGVYGCYWSRSLYTLVSYKAYTYSFGSGKPSAGIDSRASGKNIRPIRVKNVQAITVSNIELSQTERSVKAGETLQLSATVLPENATNKNVKWESSNAEIATVDETGKVVAVAVGTCTITCSATDGSGVKAECKVTVKNDNSGTLDGHDYVDLGLPSGTLWATCNVGASSPEEYGDYFAWGETQPKSEYSLSTYKYCKGERKTLTKYCMHYAAGYKGFTDTLTELLPEDDAATVNLGNDWQTPSEEQIAELIDNRYTTTTWSTYEGISGLLVTSISNGNSIFLPAGGKQTSSYLNGNGTDGCYWSRTVELGESANHLIFTSEDFFVIGYDREKGMCIRPVRAQQGQVEQVEFIELSQTELVLNSNDSRLITAAVLPKSATNKSARWESSDEAIATVDEIGEVTAVAVGTCTITCSATDGSGVKAECQVEVVENETPKYVDLGLPSGTLWATCNVGANSPEEYGNYFAWGETEPKSDYSWSTYKYCMGTENTMTKYCTESDYGTVDNKTELEAADDAATVNWGVDWQMPSLEQFEELINSSYTTTTWTTLNGKYGRKITSKSNGNSIFLPAAGCRYDTSLGNAGSDDYYWSRSLYTSSSDCACGLYFNSSYGGYPGYIYRYYGQSVRPVRVIAVSNIELSQTELSVKVGETTQLSATVLPDNATNKNLKWECSNADVATVDQSGKVISVAGGTCTITCSATDGSGVKAECIVTVTNPDNSGTLDGHEYVDLGLPSGTLWATCNVGANSPEEYGDYFAWGETQPKSDNNYSKSAYRYYDSVYNVYTKYCLQSDYGTIDNKSELEMSDDAATVNWGVDWQMPSLEQFKELINSSYTTTTWTTLNGVNGRMIVSKSNGNRIFLPAAGYRDGTSLINAGSGGYYWSRSLSANYSDDAYYLYFNSSGIYTSYYYRRYCGQGVRPVRVQN